MWFWCLGGGAFVVGGFAMYFLCSLVLWVGRV